MSIESFEPPLEPFCWPSNEYPVRIDTLLGAYADTFTALYSRQAEVPLDLHTISLGGIQVVGEAVQDGRQLTFLSASLATDQLNTPRAVVDPEVYDLVDRVCDAVETLCAIPIPQPVVQPRMSSSLGSNNAYRMGGSRPSYNSLRERVESNAQKSAKSMVGWAMIACCALGCEAAPETPPEHPLPVLSAHEHGSIIDVIRHKMKD